MIIIASGSLAAGCASSAVHFLFVRLPLCEALDLNCVTGGCVFLMTGVGDFLFLGLFSVFTTSFLSRD